MRLWTVVLGFESLHPSHFQFKRPALAGRFSLARFNVLTFERSNAKMAHDDDSSTLGSDSHLVFEWPRWRSTVVLRRRARRSRSASGRLRRLPGPRDRRSRTTRSHRGSTRVCSSLQVANSRWASPSKIRRFAEGEPRQQTEVAEVVVDPASGGGEHGDLLEPEIVEGVLEGLVEVGAVLIGALDHHRLAEPGPGRSR